LVGHDSKLKILAIKTHYQNKSYINGLGYQYASPNNSYLCCGTSPDISLTSKTDDKQTQMSGNIQEIITYSLPSNQSSEKIIFASFLEDNDPQYILIVTRNEAE